MKKHLLSIIASIVICAILLIGCGGGGGGGGGTSAPSEPTEFIYSTEANNKGSFRLTSNKSGAVIESSEEGTLATGSSIVLTERLAKSNESKLYGGNSSNIYTLQAKNGNKTIKKLDKPVILTIPNNFGKEFKTFFLGSKSETASDWQYTQILDDNDTNPTVVKTARLAVKDLNTFKVKTFRLSYSFAIFASKDSIENKPTNTDSVKLMTFSADPAKVYYDKNNKFITDIKVSSCITANKSSALFDGSEVTSQLVFFNGNSADLSGLKIDGSAAVQTSSTDKDSSNNQYSHTIYIKTYKKNNIAISGNNATYTFELKLSGVSTKDFPDSFRVKTVLKDANGTEFASEGSVKLKKEKEPEKTNTNTSTNTSTGTGTNTKTSTNTSAGTNTKTSTSTGTSTKTSTTTSTNTKTNTSTDTGSNTTTQTTTSTGSETSTDTNTASSTDTGSSTSTTTSSDTNTSTNTQTITNTDTSTGSGTSTETNTATNTGSSTETNTQTSTNTASSTDTNSNTNTSTETNTGSNTNTDTSSNTSTETNTQTSTNTNTTSNTDTSTSTGTGTNINSIKATISVDNNCLFNGKYKTNSTFTINFGNKVKDNTTAEESILSNATIEKTWIEDGVKLSVSFPYDLEANQSYSISMNGSLKDINDNDITPFDTFNFQTLPDITVTLLKPLSNTNVATNTELILELSENVNFSNLTYHGITVTRYNEHNVLKYAAFNLSYDETKKQISFTWGTNGGPYYGLYTNTDYTLTVNEGCLKNDETNQKVKSFYYYFKTREGIPMRPVISSSENSTYYDKYVTTPFRFYIDFEKSVANDHPTIKDGINLYDGDTIVETYKSWDDTSAENGYKRLTVFILNRLIPSKTYCLKGEYNSYWWDLTPIEKFDFYFTTVSGDIPIVTPSSSSINNKYKKGVTFNVTFENSVRARNDSVLNAVKLKNSNGVEVSTNKTWSSDYKVLTVIPALLNYDADYVLFMDIPSNRVYLDDEEIQIEKFVDFNFTTLPKFPDITVVFIDYESHNGNNTIRIALSDKITTSSNLSDKIVLFKDSGIIVNISSIRYDSENQDIYLTLPNQLEGNQGYKLKILSGLQNESTNQVLNAFECTFTANSGVYVSQTLYYYRW